MTRHASYRFLDPAALARIKKLSLAARGVVEGFISGSHKSPFRGFSVEFAEHREYTPGDNLRYLDWRMLARTDRLYVKQYEEETNLRCQILLDASGSMLYRHGRALTKLEYGAYLTAVLAFLMTRQQDAVGLSVFDQKLELDMPARTAPRHFGEMMRQLEGLCASRLADSPSLRSKRAPARPGEPTSQIAQTLMGLAARSKRRCLVILISDLYDDPSAVLRALHHFRHRRHEVILFHVFDQAEIDLPFRDTVRFLDLETGERLQVDPSFVRDDYQRRIQEFIAGYKRHCSESQIDYVQTTTAVPYDVMLSRYLHRRSQL